MAANREWKKELWRCLVNHRPREEKAKPEIKSQLFRRTDSQFFTIALQIVQYVAEVKKPDGDRLRIPRRPLESLRFQLLSPAPIYPSTEKLFMATALKLAQEKLGNDDAYVQAIVQGGDVD